MIAERHTTLLYPPANTLVEATIVSLTAELVEAHMTNGWWNDELLKGCFEEPPIDRHWNWNAIEIEYDGKVLESEKIAITTGEAEEELQVQGAMMVSKEPIASLLEHGGSCLMLELLFVAPRNRAKLNRDDEPFLQGAGTELLRWAAWFSRELGYEGRLRLDASPGSIGWYTRKRLRKVPAEPIVFEGVPYTPMELAPDAAQELLADWGGLEPTGGATCV